MMIKRLLLATLFSALILALIGSIPAGAQVAGRVVTPQGTFASLSEAIATAEDGDSINVYGGQYEGPIVVDKSVTMTGHDGATIDGGDEGTVVKVVAPNVIVRGFTIQHSGDSLNEENSGIAVEAPKVTIEDNLLEETLFGIYLRQADGTVIRNNVINSKDLDVPRRGDPIRIWYSNDVLVEDNIITKGRDVVLWYSEKLTIRGNEVTGGRYGLHFMYCDDATIEDNLLSDNSVGVFLMYSRRLHLEKNTIARNRGPSGYGIGLKDMDDAVIINNLILDNRIGVHLDNSPREINSVGIFEGNVFAFNDIGVNLMPSVRHNEFSGNSFVDNEQQVAIAGGSGGRVQDNAWSVEVAGLGQHGNYWSDYVGYDSDADGRGDVPYKSERLFENLMDKNSSLRLFLYSPVEQAIDFAARAVPFVKPKPKLTDDAPMMAPSVPAGLPVATDSTEGPMWIASVALLLAAVVVLALGSGTVSGARDWRVGGWIDKAFSTRQSPISESQGK